jgi:hypothetical protein
MYVALVSTLLNRYLGKELAKRHKEHLLPGFDDRLEEEQAIEILTGDITHVTTPTCYFGSNAFQFHHSYFIDAKRKYPHSAR